MLTAQSPTSATASAMPSAGATSAAMPDSASSVFAQYQIIRRNGAVVPFEPSKIAVALMKAFLAVHGTQGAASASVRETVDALTQNVVRALMRSRPAGGTFHIEDVQDQVELGLMRSGHHEVARAYVLYRERRTQERARQGAAQHVDVVGRGAGEDYLQRAGRALRVAADLGLENVGDGDELRILGGGDGLFDLEAFDSIGAQLGGGVTFARAAARRLAAGGLALGGCGGLGGGADVGMKVFCLAHCVSPFTCFQSNPAASQCASEADARRAQAASLLTVARSNVRRAAKES